MKRKMVYIGTAWAAGLTAAAVSVHIAVVSVTALVIAFLFKTVFRFNLKSIIFMLTAFIVSFGYFKIHETMIYRNLLSLNESKASYSGTITDYSDNADNKSVYYLDGTINNERDAKLILYNETLKCDIGDKLEFDFTAKTIENNFLFDSHDYYKSKGIYLQADSAENVNIFYNDFSVRKMLYDFRERVCKTINKSVPVKESGMIKGMLFGDKSGLENDDMTMLYRTGIGHVTAVSGLHLVLFCNIISFVLKKSGTGRKTEFFISEVFMLLFAICCGMSPSIIRAFIMMTLVNAAPLFFRYTDSLNSVCIAVILITIPNPFMITNQSFLLSVSGALGAGVFAPYMTSHTRTRNVFGKWCKNFLYMLCVSLAVTPMSVICFGEFSFISPLANLLITPLCMLAVLFAMIASLLICFNPEILFKVSGVLCHVVLNISDKIGSNRFTHTKLSGEFISVLLVLIIMFCVVSYMIFHNRRYTAVAIFISVLMFFASCTFYNVFDSRNLKIALLGRSQAGVIVVSKGNNADIIDFSGKTANSRYVRKYLDNMGITKINSIVMMKRINFSMSAYNSRLSLYDIDNVVIPSETYIRKDMKICNVTPKYSDFSNWNTEYSSYNVSLNNDCVTVDYGDFHFECADGKYGDKTYNTNIVLCAQSNGTFDFRRLEDG